MSEAGRLNPTQLSRLLDEIAAMVRVNRSLVPGLRTIEDARLGKIGRAAGLLRTQLEAGRSVDEVLASLDATVGPQAAAAFRLAIAGRSSEPLHRLAETLRRRREQRLAARTAMIYPLIVITAGYALWVLVFANIVSLGSLGGYEQELFPGIVVAVGTWLRYFWWIPPLVLIGCVVGLSLLIRLRPHGRLHQWLPGRFARIGLFCDSLALQIEAGVPYAEAVRLAADISGDPTLSVAAQRSAERAERGRTGEAPAGTDASGEASADVSNLFPPMIGWLVSQLSGTSQLATAGVTLQLRALAAWYEARQRSERQLWVRFVPTLIVAVFGGTLALVYMLAIIRPLYARIGDL